MKRRKETGWPGSRDSDVNDTIDIHDLTNASYLLNYGCPCLIVVAP